MTTDDFTTAREEVAEDAADLWTHQQGYAVTGTEWGAFEQGHLTGTAWARDHLAALDRPPFRCDTHLCGSCGGCRARGVEDKLSKALAEVERLRAQRTAAWDEGFGAGWAEHADPGVFVNDVWDAKTVNPYVDAP